MVEIVYNRVLSKETEVGNYVLRIFVYFGCDTGPRHPQRCGEITCQLPDSERAMPIRRRN